MNDVDNWEDQRLDSFEGDESNYWNIDVLLFVWHVPIAIGEP